MIKTGILSLKMFTASASCEWGDVVTCPEGAAAAVDDDELFSVVLVTWELSPCVEVGVVGVLVKDVWVDELGLLTCGKLGVVAVPFEVVVVADELCVVLSTVEFEVGEETSK